MHILQKIEDFWAENERICRMRGLYSYVKKHGWPRLVTAYYDGNGVAKADVKRIFRNICLQFGSLKLDSLTETQQEASFCGFTRVSDLVENDPILLEQEVDLLYRTYKRIECVCSSLGLTLVYPFTITQQSLDKTTDPLEDPGFTLITWRAAWKNWVDK